MVSCNPTAAGPTTGGGTKLLRMPTVPLKRSVASVWMVVALTGCAASNQHKDKEKEEENEVKITMDQVPPAVRDTMQREAGGGNLSGFEKETDEGKTVYEADTTIGGKTYEMKVAEDG